MSKMNPKNPLNLYKYTSFSEKLLYQLCHNQVFYADPSTFNDPLDCKPIVTADVQNDELKSIFEMMIRRRFEVDINSAIKKLRLNPESRDKQLKRVSDTEIKLIFGNLEYNATNPDNGDAESWMMNYLTKEIQRELRLFFGKGVLCLSSLFDSPLMWSHYAQQHRGVCIEYDVSELSNEQLHKVKYGESRQIKASVVRNGFKDESHPDRNKIYNASLLTKSRQWSYEREWRILNGVGLNSSLVPVKSVIFGLCCSDEIKYSIMKTLQTPLPNIKFWEIESSNEIFKLTRKRVYLSNFDGDFNPRSCEMELLSMLHNDE